MNEAMSYHIVFVFLLVPAYVRAISLPEEGGEAADKNICKDYKCERLANIIEKQMGKKKPCEDFHNYVCGKWNGDLELNETIIKKKAVFTLASLLKNASAPYIKDPNATDKLIHAYHSCTRNGKNIEMLRMSIERVIKQYNLTEWPIIEKNGRSLPLSSSDDYMDVLKKIGPRPVFSYSILEERRVPVISMTKPWEFNVYEDQEFPLLDSRSDSTSETEGATESPNYDHYDEYLKNNEEAYKKFIKKTIHLLNESINEQEMADVAEGIVRIEKGLEKSAMRASEKDDLRLNISQLDALVGHGFTMAPILKRDFEGLDIDIDEGTEVVVRYIDYYHKAVNFMRCTTKVELTNYVLWTKILEMAEATGTLLNEYYVEYKRNTSSPDFTYAEESSEWKSLKLQCMRQLLETRVMYTAGAHYYVVAKFNETAKKDVLKMMEFVNSSFMHVVQGNTWMNESTRKEAVAKLQTMDAVIGYPDWMLNTSIINAVYQFVPYIVENASFAEHFHFLRENDHKQTLLKLKPGMYFDKVKESVTLRSHAYYEDASNSFAYPAASLVTHYRWHPIPRSANFGTIGTILGQLFATSIERYSHKSQETGKYTKDNWDPETAMRFCNRSSCLNNTEECNGTSPSGSNKHEKFRDYLGLRISYEAMQNSRNNYTPPFLLPDEDKFDSESKIFFLLFGSLYCPYRVNKKQPEPRSADGNMSADETRYHDSLNEIVYTYIEFNKTFQCQQTPGADTCDLMPPSGVPPLPNC